MVSGRLVEAFAKNSKPKGFEDIVPTTLHEYADVFSETTFDSLPECRKWDHAIELEREPSPGFRKVYPMTLTEQMEMDAFLEEALATGRIRQSKSPLGAPVFFIKKKDGKLLRLSILDSQMRCNVPHNPDIRNVTYKATSRTTELSMPSPGKISTRSH
jgi:hypothetical protein